MNAIREKRSGSLDMWVRLKGLVSERSPPNAAQHSIRGPITSMHLCGHNARAIRRLLSRAASQHSSLQAKRKRQLRGLHSKHGTSPHPHEINACKSAPPKRRLLRWTLFSANSMRSNRVHHNKRIPDPSSLCYICDGSCPLCINHNHNHSDHDHSHKA